MFFVCAFLWGGHLIYTSTHPTKQVSYEETRSSSPFEATAAKMSEESQDPEPSAKAARLEEERDKHVGGKEVCRPEAQLRFILLNSSFELVAIQGYPSTLMKIKLTRFSP